MSEKYTLESAAAGKIGAPDIFYGPPTPKNYRPKIGLVGCGGITEHHLKAYRASGLDVVAMYDLRKAAAEKRRDEFYPNARVCESVDEMLSISEIEVFDIATHPAARAPLIDAAIKAGRHVLSQKPFVLDLNEGARLVALAREKGVKLAVNQNGRWAPYFCYLRKLVRAGVIGEVSSVDIAVNWDHTWTAGTEFEKIHHLVLYDFAIHWFDAVHSFFGCEAAKSIFATVGTAAGQPVKPPLLASSVVSFPAGIATLSFNGHGKFGARESCTIVGTKGTLRAIGGVCSISSVEVCTQSGNAVKELSGSWFPDGFRGTMGELLCSIEENREPENSAADNLKSLALCFGAMKSADEGRPVQL